MKKNEIKKAHEKAVARQMPKAIKDHARYEAHSRVSEALAETRGEEKGNTAVEHEARPSTGSTETARKTGTRVFSAAEIEHKLGRG